MGPTWNVYVGLCLLAALPVFAFLMGWWEKKNSLATAYGCLFLPFLMLLYLRNTIVRLEEQRIVQGFIGTSIPYEDVEGIHREIRSRKSPAPTLVIAKRDSRKRIVIYIHYVDDAKLRQFIRLLKQKAPHISADDLTLAPFATALERQR